MALLNRHEKCIGLTIFKWGQRRAEIWYCPAGYIIQEHCHPAQNVELMYLFGSTTFYRRNLWNNSENSLKCGWKTFCRRFTVRNFHAHWFSVGKLPLLFVNFQHFLPGNKPCSAAEDFEITYKE